MISASELINKKYKVLGSFEDAKQDSAYLIGYDKAQKDLISWFLEKNKDIKKHIKLTSLKNADKEYRETIQQARAFREIVEFVEKEVKE